MREVRSMSRAGRRNQILLAFAIKIKHGLGKEMTAYEIARKIDLRPTSPNFRSLLNQMVEDGLLKVEANFNASRMINGRVSFIYFPAQEIEPVKRSISVRAAGKQIGQLELF